MKAHIFNLDSLNIGELIATDELTAIDAGATISIPGMADKPAPSNPGYTDATIIWSQIP